MDLRAGLSINGVSTITSARAGAFSSLTNGATLAGSDSSSNCATTQWVKSLGYTSSTGDATVGGNNVWTGINDFTKELTILRGTAATTGIAPLDFDPNNSALPMVYQAWTYNSVATPTTDAHGTWHLTRNAQPVAEGTNGTPVGSTYPQWSQQRNNPSWDFQVGTDGFTMRYLPTQGSVATFYDAAWKQQLKVGASSVDIGSSTNSMAINFNGSALVDTSGNWLGTRPAIAGAGFNLSINMTTKVETWSLAGSYTGVWNATAGYSVNTTQFIDSSLNVSNIGTLTTSSTITSGGSVTVARASASNNALYCMVSGEVNPRFYSTIDGTLNWGAGGGTAVDTNLYRSAVGTLKTDDAFQAASYAVGTTSVIDSGRNLNNIAALTMAGTFLTNSGTAATSGVTLVNSPDITLRGKYWNGTASTTYDATIRHTMSLASGPGSSIDFLFGGTSKASIANNGNVAVNGLYINTTQVIDSSRNLLNVGTISSGALTSSGAVQGTQFNVGSTNIIDTSGNVTQPAWQTPSSLTTPWIAYSDAAWQSVRYMKDRDGTVHVQGLVVYNGPAPSAATTVFTLPGGYTPAKNLTFASVANNQFARLNVLSSGAVQWEGGASPTSWFSISCSFKAG